MTDRPTEKPTVAEMTQLEAMERIVNLLHDALPLIVTAKLTYKKILSERKFAPKEIQLLVEAYDKTLFVWHGMINRKRREEKNAI